MSGCSEEVIILTGAEGIPDEVFRGINPVYPEENTLGNLTTAYIRNTESLHIVNGRLDLLCESHEIEDCGPR